MVTEIKETIQQITEDSSRAQDVLVKGSNAYLDKVNDLRTRFCPLVEQLGRLNDRTIEEFNQNGDEVYDRILPLMQPLYDSCIRNIESLKASPLVEGLKTLIQDFEDEASQLKENMEDIVAIHDVYPNDEELQELISQL